MEDEWKKRKKELIEIGMIDEVVVLIRDCIFRLMDIRYIGEDVFFKSLKEFLINNKFWIREGIGEELLDEMMWELDLVPYSENSRNNRMEKMVLYEEKLKEIKEKLTEEDDKIYH